MPSQSPIASASSTTGFSGISRPPRNWPSAAHHGDRAASTMRSWMLLREKPPKHDRVRGADARARLHRITAWIDIGM
jgi:hypothetical protein